MLHGAHVNINTIPYHTTCWSIFVSCHTFIEKPFTIFNTNTLCAHFIELHMMRSMNPVPRNERNEKFARMIYWLLFSAFFWFIDVIAIEQIEKEATKRVCNWRLTRHSDSMKNCEPSTEVAIVLLRKKEKIRRNQKKGNHIFRELLPKLCICV